MPFPRAMTKGPVLMYVKLQAVRLSTPEKNRTNKGPVDLVTTTLDRVALVPNKVASTNLVSLSKLLSEKSKLNNLLVTWKVLARCPVKLHLKKEILWTLKEVTPLSLSNRTLPFPSNKQSDIKYRVSSDPLVWYIKKTAPAVPALFKN
jgi:hypothetical protein